MRLVRCPLCDLASEAHRGQCSCGFRLSATKQEILAALRGRAQAQALLMFAGLAVLAASGGLTAAMLHGAEARGGGEVIVFSGLMFTGVAMLVRGFFGRRAAVARIASVSGPGDRAALAW